MFDTQIPFDNCFHDKLKMFYYLLEIFCLEALDDSKDVNFKNEDNESLTCCRLYK